MAGFFIVVLLLAAMAALIALGMVIARDQWAAEHVELQRQRELLHVEWAALNSSAQVNDVLFRARDDLRRAEGRSSDPTVIDGEWS